jgi:cyclase
MRVIARLDIKNEFLIKGIHLEGLRKLGNPQEFAIRYGADEIDELVFMDAVASLYGRNNLYDLIEKATQNVFVPITLGGGVRTLEDVDRALKAGADKVAINTAAVRNPGFVTEVALRYGSQCCVGSIEAKRDGPSWRVLIETGRERTELDAVEWARRLEDLGAGELLVTSVDQEGTKKGFDLLLMEAITAATTIPVVASGGAGNLGHLQEVASVPHLSGVVIASLLHYNLSTVSEAKKAVVKRPA